ncbi:MAG: hypothetical protein M5R41_19085 [Bacteroidia bacterium]|nr:hypothetical protein [Bacteroidia bacterium]
MNIALIILVLSTLATVAYVFTESIWHVLSIGAITTSGIILNSQSAGTKKTRWFGNIILFLGMVFSIYATSSEDTENLRVSKQILSSNMEIIAKLDSGFRGDTSSVSVWRTEEFSDDGRDARESDFYGKSIEVINKGLLKYLSDSEIKEMSLVKPVLRLDASQSKNSVVIDIESINEEGTSIDALYLKFDIPGIMTGYSFRYRDKADLDTLYARLLTGHGGKTTSETVYVSFKRVFPTSFVRLVVDYIPTKIGSDPDFSARALQSMKIEQMKGITLPPEFLDLHDYLRCSYFWSYKGIMKPEYMFHDMAALSYIREDNFNMAQRLDWFKDTSDVRSMELRRRKW